ncbi:MAG: YlbF family regulator [Planctomycetota bacterium]
MPTTDELTDAATKLGELLKDHDAVKNLHAANKAFADDTATQRALLDFQRAIAEVSAKEQAGQPIEVSDKKRLRDAQEAVIRNPMLGRMQTAQMDYFDLLRSLDKAMQDAAGVDESTLNGLAGAMAPRSGPGSGGPGSGAGSPGGQPGLGGGIHLG